MESDSVNMGGASDARFLASSQRLPKLLIPETHCLYFLKDQQAECSFTILHSKPQPCYPPGFSPSVLPTKQWCRLQGLTLDREFVLLKPLAMRLVCKSSWFATLDCFKHPDIERNYKYTIVRIRGAQLSTQVTRSSSYCLKKTRCRLLETILQKDGLLYFFFSSLSGNHRLSKNLIF